MASFDRLFYFGSFSVGKASPGGAGGLWPLCERLFLLFGYEQAPYRAGSGLFVQIDTGKQKSGIIACGHITVIL